VTTHRHGPDHAHDHHHGPGHDHEHDHPLESITHVHGGASALDIGGNIGALVVLMDESALGTELFLRSVDDADFSVHTGVWKRDMGTGHVVAALFCELVSGTYWVLDTNGGDVCSVHIDGGSLSELDLRDRANAVSQ